ncbi:MAG: 2-dehydropantoate 2-reductase [Spirochaetales bacterium]|nr:2-dehydropantoate 2-reductase [Spirochaetales bacterium]
MTVGIVGAGAMGSLFGGRLAQAGVEVILFDINEAHVTAIQREGLRIEELATGKTEVARPRATSEAEELRDADYLLVFVKSAATAVVAERFASLAGPQAVAVTVQNGLGNEGILKSHFRASRTAAGVTAQGATFVGPGHIRHAGRGPTHLCMSDRHNERLDPLVDALNRAGLDTAIEDNIENLIWSKLIINVGINALTALVGVHNGKLLECDETLALMADLVEEAVAVARAKGITLTYEDPLGRVKEVAEKTGRNRSSMLQDFDNRRGTEIEFINGAVVREAEALGIPAPVNRSVTRLVKAVEARFRREQG